MSLFGKLLGKKNKIKIAEIHSQEIDPFYSEIDIEQIGLYQLHFNKILEKVDVLNYTKWSLSQDYDREKLNGDDEWMYDYLVNAEKDGINGGILQNMVNQYFFADILQREAEKSIWISRVIHRKSDEDYFPDGQQLRRIMELLS